MRRYTAPRPNVNKVAALLPGEPKPNPRDVVLKLRDGNRFQRISNLHAAYEPLRFLIIYPHDDSGWHLNMPYVQNPEAKDCFVAAQQRQDEQVHVLLEQPAQWRQGQQQQQDEEGGEDEQSRKPQQKRDSHAAYCLHERAGEANDHLRWCYLLQEAIVDSGTKIEGQRLRFVQHNQEQLQANKYKVVQEAIEAGLRERTLASPLY
ncbi:hypothetical protein WJX79_009945 [Trebouxia sp. C0005]